MPRNSPITALLACAFLAPAALAQPAETSPSAFTYQGSLTDAGQPANGLYDMRFDLADDSLRPITSLCVSNVEVVDGLFSVVLDPGEDYPQTLLEKQNLILSVRPATNQDCSDPEGFVELSPAQRIRPTPLATRARISAAADTANIANIANTANTANTALSLQGLPPSHFTDPANLVGTIPFEKLPQNLARSDNTNLFTGTNVFLQPLGLGTIPGSEMLRVRAEQSRATLVSDFSTNGSVLTLENQTFGLATGNYVGAINFSTPGSTPGQIGYVKGPSVWQDSLQFRVGLLPGVAIDGQARLGVGTLAPQARVHIASGNSGVSPNLSTQLLIDTAGTHYISSLIRDNEESGILFGRPAGGQADAGVVYNNVGTRGGLQLRTGGNQTRMFIDNAGTVTVPGTLNVGTLSTPNLTYSTPKVHHRSLGIRAFNSVGGGGALTGLSGERLTGSGFSSLGTSLDLPQGARITNITIYVFDNDASGNMAILLSQTSFTGTFTNLREHITSGAQLGYQAINMTPATPYIVDNLNNMLNLEVGMAVLSPWSNGMAIIGARVTYTTDGPQ